MASDSAEPGIGAVPPWRGRRGAAIAWCFYDWANSSYPTVIVTFVFAAYFTRGVAETPELGTGQWGMALSISGLVLALLAPILGAIADQGGGRKPWIGFFTLLSVGAALGLWWIEPDPRFILPALLLVALGNAAFEFGHVFYNAMLPDMAPHSHLGRLSGWAGALGYLGGLICLGLCLVLFVMPEVPLFGLDKAMAEEVRITGPFVGLWFAVFAVPLFLFAREKPRPFKPAGAVRAGLASLWQTLRALPQHGQIGRFLLARMFYTDGLNTLFAFGGIYAAGTFGMSFEDILIFGILLNVTAGLGAFAFAWLDDLVGAKTTILVSVAALTLLGGAILVIESQLWFYLLGCAIGVFIGPAQTASRSFMARVAPAELRAEFFGLYALSGKATAFLGPALVGWVTVMADSQRAGMATILVFFLLGLVLLWPIRDPQAR
ncbi:MFS transporter [Pelagibius litoralis]|uniref:MFS transporter n=1 Tax=Pelagibius litoralis TaxID=374515 RepID=A0A967KBD6_9PROT|nr:MFS transporter [Pelagibius litoralis]NIA71022.1 MFS transporter [Pelagibius litoralis]